MKNLDHSVDFAKHLRRSETSGEYLMWQIVRNRQRKKMKFRRQHPLGPFVADFYCPEVRLVIECDGKDHFTEEGKAYDDRRDAWMRRNGIEVLRFTNQAIENDTQSVMQVIEAKLIELSRPSPPAPLSPETGRGGDKLDVDTDPLSPETGRGGDKVEGKNGFTLVELLVTLVIVSVLAAVTLPAFKNVIVERKTSVAALEVKAFLDAARARAIARGRPVSVILERLSSRTDGIGIDNNPINPISPSNPPRSITAENPNPSLSPAWQPSSVDINYAQYNSCIRLVMAEALRPIDFEVTLNFLPEPTSGPFLPLNDGDGLTEPGRILSIANTDARLGASLEVGNEIEIVASNDQTYRFQITAGPILAGANYGIAIRNEGNDTYPFGTLADVNRMASDQLMVRPFIFISSISAFRVVPRPRPVGSMVVEMPKGSCIDLSLSGLANDDPNVNAGAVPSPLPFVLGHYRDCRREFASDWILPPLGSPPAVPTPQDLRPVYLTFGPKGTLQSVLCNGPNSSSLRRIEPQSDVCLFVGRTDQVIRNLGSDELAAAEDASLKPNLMDLSGYWVRISPTSGAISAAPAQASHIIEDVADYRSTGTVEAIAHLIQDSRSLIFGAELTSQ